jgi:hypothetical protein
MQSPALKILKQVDDLLFCHLPKMERLAVAYKSFKLLKVRAPRHVHHQQRLTHNSTTSHPPNPNSPKSPPGCAPGTPRSLHHTSHLLTNPTNSPSQSSTSHPIALDFFAWPTLRDRLVQNHTQIFQSPDLSKCYSQYLRFDWPFAFEDAFFWDEGVDVWRPSPVFEKWHGELGRWSVDEKFFGRFPELRGDIQGRREA